VLYLPHREASVCVRFSPMMYALRAGLEEKLFDLPYRMVYAVATVAAVTLHDTQQMEPFARISQIHYISLTDLAW